MRRIFYLLLVFLMLMPVLSTSPVWAEKQVNVWFFYSNTCPHCQEVINAGVLENLPPYAEIKYFEISENASSRKLFLEITRYYNIPAGVPTVLIFTDDPYSGKVIQGDKNIIADLPDEVKKAGAGLNLDLEEQGEKQRSPVKTLHDKVKNNLMLLVIVTAAADSVNPCIMAVLVLLLATLSMIAKSQHGRISKKARKKLNRQLMKTGMIYTAVVFVTYVVIGLLLIGGAMLVFNELAVSSSAIAFYTKLLVALLVGFAGVVNIKDFFWYGRGISFMLPPKYVRRVKSLANRATIPAVISAALIVTIVEFPCSGMMYLGLVTYLVAINVEFIRILFYLLIYNVIFIMPLVIITLLAMKSISKVEETRLKYRRVFRLVMGIALVVLAILIILV